MEDDSLAGHVDTESQRASGDDDSQISSAEHDFNSMRNMVSNYSFSENRTEYLRLPILSVQTGMVHAETALKAIQQPRVDLAL